MKHKLLLAILISTLGLSACASLARSGLEPASAPMPMATMSADFGIGGGAPALQESYAAPVAPADVAKGAITNQATSADRLVVRNADLTIVVSDVPARVAAIQNMANAMGGFVVSSNLYETYTRDGQPVPQAQVIVRVPQQRLGEALTQIKANTVEVQNENQTGQDVTDQYVDLQSRLTAKLAAEEQLTAIMKDARRTEDVLAVYAQLQQIQSDIEVLRGQIKYTEQSAALSAISVNIIAEETVKPIEVGGWKPEGVARDAIQKLIYFWQDFVDFMIGFGLYTLPVLITIAIPLILIFLLLRWIFRKLRKPRAQTTSVEPALKKK
ncbi:MAG TPA: DUF4349 domain-containing protein [Anaerolineales bacterium]